MIPSQFGVKMTGDGASPIPVKITIGQNLLILGIAALVVALLVTSRKYRK